WPPSTDSDSYGWQAGTDGGRLMANALRWAARKVRNPVNHILVFNDSGGVSPFASALTALSLPFESFGLGQDADFSAAVAGSSPANTLFIVDVAGMSGVAYD